MKSQTIYHAATPDDRMNQALLTAINTIQLGANQVMKSD